MNKLQIFFPYAWNIPRKDFNTSELFFYNCTYVMSCAIKYLMRLCIQKYNATSLTVFHWKKLQTKQISLPKLRQFGKSLCEYKKVTRIIFVTIHLWNTRNQIMSNISRQRRIVALSPMIIIRMTASLIKLWAGLEKKTLIQIRGTSKAILLIP